MSAPGKKIGQYLLSKKLGEGGMGAVYLGEHEFTGRMAAIKMISGGHFESEDSIQRLKGEARVRFKDGDYDVIGAGDFVRCAVTGEVVILSELRYWSVERQEAYANPAAALKRHKTLLAALQ